MSLSDAETHLLQRVVLPTGQVVGPLGGTDASGVLPLYVDGSAAADRVVGRRGYRVGGGERVSFGSYVNAFAAGYWRRWTDVEQVTLVAETDGAATIELFASDASGRARRVETLRCGGDAAVQATVPLTGFDDGGWLWFDVVAGDADVELRAAAWTAPAPTGAAAAPSSTVSVGITTYNRVDSCLALLRQLGEDPGLLEIVDTVYVVDQGERRIRSAEGFAGATAGLGDRLTVLEQANLGGSGGFARAQLETLRDGRSRHLVLLDDDVVLEPESLRRAVAFADRCTQPTLVGAQMFSLAEPTRLYAMAESVALRTFQWGPAQDQGQHDLAASGLRDTPWLHRRADGSYNGWWMCLVPREAMEKVGLSLPFFIRWDDAEFGLRAGEAGFPTVTLPGVSVWHVPWTHKTDALDWQAYFHQRNRIVAALLHSPHERGGLLVADLLAHQVKQLASMQYSTAELRLLAMADVLAGPEALHPALATKHVEARRLRDGYPDADVRADPGAFPPAAGTRRPRRTPLWATAVLGVARQILPVSGESRRTPQVYLPAAEAHWTQLLKYDSAVVSTADGSGATWYRRDREMFADITRRSLAMHLRLFRAWPRLAAEYRGALARLAAPEAWQQTFQSTRRGE